MRFVFLIYVSRSGSTLFARHLSEACDGLLVVPESRVFERVLSLERRVIETLGPRGLARVLAEDEREDPLRASTEELESVWPQFADEGIPALLGALVRLHALREGKGAFSAAVLKWGQIVRLRHKLSEVAPDAAFIHVYRDPRAVANSMIKSRRPYFRNEQMGRGDPVFIGRGWASFQRTVRSMQQEGWPVVEVRYETFCSEPMAELRRVAEELRLPMASGTRDPGYRVAAAEADIHRLVDKPPSVERAEAWRAESARYVVLAVERNAGEEMTRRGYEPVASGRVERLLSGPPAALLHGWKTVVYYWRRVIYYVSRPRIALGRWRLMRARRGGR